MSIWFVFIYVIGKMDLVIASLLKSIIEVLLREFYN